MLPPVLIFIRTEGREGKRERCTHTHVSTSLRFVRLNLEFVSKFSHYFFRSPFCVRAPKIPLRESKEDFESTEIRILRFRAIYPRNERRTFINKIANARFRSIARSIAKLELLGSSSINWRRCTDGSVVIFFRPYNFQNFLAPCPRGRNIINRERCIGVRMDRLWLHISWMQMERRLIFSSSLQLTRFPGTHARPRSSICSRVCRSRVGK